MSQSVFRGTNRYRMLREGREYINKVATRYGSVEKKLLFDLEYHVVDQLIAREFPARVFEIITGRLIKHHQEELIGLADLPADKRPKRINVYSDMPNSPYMIGITVSRSVKTGFVYVNMRTCYKERNHKNRKRIIEAYKIRVKNGDILRRQGENDSLTSSCL